MNDQITELKAAINTLFDKFVLAVASPKPSYSLDGQSVQHNDYLKMLLEGIKTALELLQMIEPFEHRSVIL